MDFIWCEKEGYGFLNDYLELKKELQNSNSINEKILISIILVFESVRIVLREFSYSRIEGAHYMDIYVHAARGTKVNAYSTFN